VARWLDARPDEDAADAVARLARDVGVDGLADLGVDESDVPALAERTMGLERLLAGNPRRVDREAIELICRDAL
jgi:alcohol dehydrogenase class IV